MTAVSGGVFLLPRDAAGVLGGSGGEAVMDAAACKDHMLRLLVA